MRAVGPAPAPQPPRRGPVELPDSLIPPDPQRPEPAVEPKRRLRSEPFPSQDEFTPSASGDELIQASFEAATREAAAETKTAAASTGRDTVVDPNVQTLPTTNPFAEFMTETE